MTQRDLFRIVVGLMILGSVALGKYVSPNWYWFTVFIGANMLQSAFTHFCPMDMMMKKTGLPR